MAKERTMNEIRQTKEYYTGNKPRQVLSDVAGEYYADNSEPVENYEQWANKANKSEEMKQNRCPLDPVEEAKILIVDKITKHFHDVMFEMVNEEMMEHKVFQSENYLTEAGYELFEDEYFEFYHEHHGDVLYEVMKNITY